MPADMMVASANAFHTGPSIHVAMSTPAMEMGGAIYGNPRLPMARDSNNWSRVNHRASSISSGAGDISPLTYVAWNPSITDCGNGQGCDE